MDHKILCATFTPESIDIIDKFTMEKIDYVRSKSIIKKLLRISEHLVLCTEWHGYVEIFNQIYNEIVFTGQLEQKSHIHDVIRTSRMDEYAFATD